MDVKKRNYDIWATYGLLTSATTDYNLIEAYKTAIKKGQTTLEWDKGIVNIFDISAIVER